jgi:hypothetical protein
MHRLVFAVVAAFLAMAAAYVGIQKNQLTASQPVCLAGQYVVLDGHIWWVHGDMQAFNLPGNHTAVLIRGNAMVNGTIFGNYTEIPCK